MKGLDAGQFRRTVGFQEPTDARNSEGGKERAFAFAFNCMAKIQENSNSRSADITPVLLNTDTVFIRYSVARSAIGKDWQVTYDGLTHVIHSIELLGEQRNEYIKLIVKAVE